MPGPEPHPPARWLRDRLVAWEVLAIALAATLLLWMLVSRQTAREARARFDAETERLVLEFKSELALPLLALDGFRGLFDDPREVDPGAWKAFVRHFDVQHRFPGMRAMGFGRAVRPADVKAFPAYARRLLGREVLLHPGPQPGSDGLQLAILFMEPELERFEEILGLDLMYDATRRDAALQAVRSGAACMTPPLTLQRGQPGYEENHPGVVIYLPVFQRAATPDPPEARARSLRGVVFASFLADEFLGRTLGRRSDLEVRVEDTEASWKGRPLYDSAGPEAGRGWRFERSALLAIGQRTWKVRFRAAPGFSLGLKEWAPTGVLLGGLVFSALLFGFGRVQMKARARAEALAAALQDSEDRFRSLADTAACIIILFSDVIEYVNDYALALLGYSREEILGKPFWHTVHPGDQALVQARGLARLRGEAVPNRYEFRLVGKDGREHWIDFTAGKIRWGGRTLALATAFDITDRVHAVDERLHLERKMLEAQRLESLGLLAGGIAHDFNNLLGAILGHASLIEDSLPAGVPVRGSLEAIRATTQKAAELSRQMLAYSGRGTVVVEPLSLNQHVRTIRSLLEVSVPKKARVELQLGEGLPAIKADAGQLHQVIINLVTNAAEAIQGEGTIRIRTSLAQLDAARLARLAKGEGLAPGPYVCLEVEDTGKGMDAATLGRIFDPFFSTKFAGRGLGLAALQGIVQGHGGGIEVESRPGAGSCFRILFPPTAEAGTPATDTGPVALPRTPAGKGRVLVADDEVALLEATSEVLRRAGFEVVGAEDGGAAVARFAEDPAGFDLAILDLTMPVLDGRECFRRLRALRPDLKVILASGYSGLDAGAQFGEAELAGFLQKPYRSRELIEMVRKVLGQPG